MRIFTCLLMFIAILAFKAHAEKTSYEYQVENSVVGLLLEVRGYQQKACGLQTYIVLSDGKVLSDETSEVNCTHDAGVLSVLCTLPKRIYSALHNPWAGTITFEPNRERGINSREKVYQLGKEIREILENRKYDSADCLQIMNKKEQKGRPNWTAFAFLCVLSSSSWITREGFNGTRRIFKKKGISQRSLPILKRLSTEA